MKPNRWLRRVSTHRRRFSTIEREYRAEFCSWACGVNSSPNDPRGVPVNHKPGLAAHEAVAGGRQSSPSTARHGPPVRRTSARTASKVPRPTLREYPECLARRRHGETRPRRGSRCDSCGKTDPGWRCAADSFCSASSNRSRSCGENRVARRLLQQVTQFHRLDLQTCQFVHDNALKICHAGSSHELANSTRSIPFHVRSGSRRGGENRPYKYRVLSTIASGLEHSGKRK